MEKIILASGSPRRYSLLTGYGFEVTVDKPDFDESVIKETDPEALVTALAKAKNECVRLRHGGETVLSADTVVAIGGKILGKPHGFDEAYEMLSLLSGNTHSVFTGVCIFKNGKERLFAVKSDVTFYKLSQAQITAYIDTGSPFDKAGGYGIQDDMGIGFIKTVDGEISNVIGLPMGKVVSEILREE